MILRQAQALAKPFLLGIGRKIHFWRQGEGIVPDTCQIAGLREHYRTLEFPPNGFFVEIGGYDGETWSNTSFLADEGWTGLYVEPVPGHARKIAARHFLNRVRVEQRAVTSQPGTMTFSSMGPLSTAVSENRRAYEQIEWARELAAQARDINVIGEPLGAIFSRNRVPFDFDLLVVDVEGAEEAVFEALLESPWTPRIIIAELEDDHDSFTEFAEIRTSHARARAAIISAGYRVHHRDPINTIFVRL